MLFHLYDIGRLTCAVHVRIVLLDNGQMVRVDLIVAP